MNASFAFALDGLVKSRFTDDFVISSKFKARVLTTTRRAGDLDFRPAAEKTKARQCLQRYVCESKQSRVMRRIRRRRTAVTIRRRRKAQRRSWTSNEVEPFLLLWERHLAAMIVAGSHSHKGDTSLPTGRRNAP
jgi:hypothetical protein